MTSQLRKTVFAILIGSVAAACGGGHDVDPSLIAGGGIADPGIDGEVNIYVIDNDTGAPIQDAMVHVGDGAAMIEGNTDATGLFVASGDSLSGPQNITAMATSYATSTWFGADGANVTINLTPDSGTASVPQATLTGTIDGWDTMTPPQGEALVAVVRYSANSKDGDPANNITQPGGTPPPYICLKLPGTSTACNWSLITRTGSQVVYAMVGHAVVSGGLAITFTDFAYKAGVTVVDGVDQNGIALAMAAAGDVEIADVSIPSAPTGTDKTAAIAQLNVGADGRIQMPLAGDIFGNQVSIDQFVMPKASLFAGSTLDLIGMASSSTNDNAQSLRFDRGATSTVGASISAFPALPTGVATAAGTFSFSPVASATLHVFHVDDADGARAWDAVILDGSTSVTQPAAVTLPSGSLTYTVQGIEVPDADLQDFAIPDVQDALTGISGDGVTFTN